MDTGYVRTYLMFTDSIVSPQQDTYINLVEEKLVGIVLGSKDVYA